MSSIAQTSMVEHGRRRWWVLLITCVPLFMMMLDVTIVTIALPHIMSAFNTGVSTVEWVLNAYVLTFAVLLITLGKLGDLYCRKLLFLGGLGLFTISSLACGLAPNITVLIVARVFQAMGGAAMMPATLSILNVALRGKRQGHGAGDLGGGSRCCQCPGAHHRGSPGGRRFLALDFLD